MPNELIPFTLVDGLRLELDRISVFGWRTGRSWSTGTAWGIVTAGRPLLRLGEDVFPLRPGAFFVAPEPGAVTGGEGMLIVDQGPRGLRQIGGPLEPKGRLRYIDGCTDTLLVCPPRLGEPSLNHLHIPPHTDQTPHTHASDRIGVIAGGAGVCRSLSRLPLQPGMGWWIPADTLHSFVTTDQSLDVIAWHPDSVFGPTDQLHPMKSGTLLASPKARAKNRAVGAG